MNRKRRILTGTSLLTFTEIISRFFPLLIIRQTTNSLGLGAFGEAQVLLTVIDVLVQFIGPGYGTLAAIDVAKNPSSKEHVSQIVSSTIAIRAIHAFAILTLLIPLAPYLAKSQTFTIVGLFLLTIASIVDLDFLHTSLQRISAFSVISLATKTLGLVGILTLVQNPSDKLIYCAITIGTNSLFSLCSYFYNSTSLHLMPVFPSIKELRLLFKRALPFNLGLVGFGVIDRLDLLIVKKLAGDIDAGIYAVPLKLIQAISPFLISVSRVFFSEMLTESADRVFITRIVRIETLLMWGILAPIAIGSIWTAPFVLDLLFATNDPSYGVLMCTLSLSIVTSLALHIFGNQILWRHGDHSPVTYSLLLVIILCLILSVILHGKWSLPGVATGIVLGKLVGAAILAKRSRPYLSQLPIREFLIIGILAIIMGAFVSLIPSPPAALAVGVAVYAVLQYAYYVLDPKHPLKS